MHHPNKDSREIIIEVLARIASTYPYQAYWWLYPIRYFDWNEYKINNKYKEGLKYKFSEEILNKIELKDKNAHIYLKDGKIFYKTLLKHASGKAG